MIMITITTSYSRRTTHRNDDYYDDNEPQLVTHNPVLARLAGADRSRRISAMISANIRYDLGAPANSQEPIDLDDGSAYYEVR